MSCTVIVIGAGMGGLTAALRLARAGGRVIVVEAREGAGGLASGLERGGMPFDAGPYILLDRPGLEWAFRAVGLVLEEHVALRRVEDVYEVTTADGPAVRFLADLTETAAGFDRIWPGSGRRYEGFVHSMARIYDRLRPLLRVSRAGPVRWLRGGAWRHLPFLRRPLGTVLARAGLPPAVAEAVAIWTHIAGQTTAEAPSPLAFVPAMIHTAGAYYPAGGIAAVPRALETAAEAAGVEIRFGTSVGKIVSDGGRVRGVETSEGTFLAADAVVSNAGGVGTYLDLVRETPPSVRRRLEELPLQSPGVCAYLAVNGEVRPPYLRFLLPGGDQPCRLLVLPAVVAPELSRDGWAPARLIAPMRHAEAERLGASGQRAYLDRILAEPWWREQVGEARVLDTRIPVEWGAAFRLHRDSMNPVMNARLMRAGRLAHRSPYVRRLYLAGSATHPGQWVSFCAISGVLAADALREDLC
jgi:phytoene desaturase